MKTTIIKSKSVAITSALFLTLATLIGAHATPSYADTPASSSSSANASITVANTINLTLTGGDLVIDNLTPGNASDSNIITATITSNSPYGYHLSATTGTSSGTTSLVNTADSNFSFINLNTNKATLNDFSDNTWGYSYSTDNGTTWISGDYGTALAGYNGLILDNDDSGATGTTLCNNDSYAGSTAVKFKIGAKSATTQAAGTYTGTVNFYAVANPGPPTIDNTFYMQELSNMSTADFASFMNSMVEEQQYTLKDNRDEKPYFISKLKDGKIWMTQNLDVCIGCANVDAFTSLNTDLNTAGSGAYNEGYSTESGVITWTPSSTAITSGRTITKDSTANVSNWADDDSVPYSAEGDDIYVYKRETSYGEAYYSMTECTNAGHTQDECRHYHTGDYYNWSAAIASNDSSSLNSAYSNAENSICPSGWRLPMGTKGSGDDGSTREFGQQLFVSGVIPTLTTQGRDYTAGGFEALISPPLYYGLFGYVSGHYRSATGGYSFYQSKTVSNDQQIYAIRIEPWSIYPASSYARANGYTVRCIARGH